MNRSYRIVIGVAVISMALATPSARAQWTSGSGGAIYYNGGNIGIGTANPIWNLHIRSGADQNLLAGSMGWYLTGAVGLNAANDANNAYVPLALTGSKIVLSGGNVGIGTTNPQYLLAVKGTVGAEEFIVTNTGWSDYVFQPGYRLRPLREVNTYIRTHHHLPGIPPAAEVKEKGVSIGEMQSKLLAKIEELTLHMIRQEEENQNLRDRIARLEKGAK